MYLFLLVLFASQATYATIAGAAGGDLQGFYPNPTLVSNYTPAGPIGSATSCASITVDGTGRVTALTTVALSGFAPTGPAGGVLTGSTYPSIALAPTGVTAATYSNPILTVTSGGQVTTVASGVISTYSRFLSAASATTTGDFLVYFDSLQTNVGWTTVSNAQFQTTFAGFFYISANVYVTAVGNLQLNLQVNGTTVMGVPAVHSVFNGQTFTLSTIMALGASDTISLSFGLSGITYSGSGTASRIRMVYIRPNP